MRATRSPSPQPSPQGEGATPASSRLGLAIALPLPGERAGVRGNGSLDNPAKFRRSGMELTRLNDWRRACLDLHGRCRSYGAWLSLKTTVPYKHGAPNGFGFALGNAWCLVLGAIFVLPLNA